MEVQQRNKTTEAVKFESNVNVFIEERADIGIIDPASD